MISIGHKLKYHLILISILTNVVFASHAQYNQPLKDYTIEVWSAKEGLPSNNLRHIAKDKDGFLWISTFNGLVRFDGNKFKTFDVENIPVISTSVFYSVLHYGEGNMFISTQSSGLVHYKNGKFTKIVDAKNLSNSIQISFLDASGRLWIGTKNAGVYYLEDDKITRFSIPSFNNRSIMSFTQDSQNNIWIASEGAGVARVRGDNVKVFTTKEGLVSNIVNAVYYHDGHIHAGTEKGLSTFNNKKWATDPRFSEININYIAEDAHNNVWFATGIGLARITLSNVFEFIGEQEGMPSRQISSLAFDNENNVWLTTKQGGLVQLEISNFKNITPAKGLSYKIVNTIEEDINGVFYIGSDNGDIDVIKNGQITKLTLKKDLKNISIKDIFADDDGTLWIATYDGLIKKKGDIEEYFSVKDGLLSNKIRRIFKDTNGVIWVGSRNGGLNKIHKDGRVESIAIKDGLGSNFVFSVDQTPDGRMLVGTSNGGLNIIYKDGKIDILKPDSILTGLSIFNVYIENDNRFWLATNVGLYCYQNNKFNLINTKNGLVVETIFDIKEDKNGYLWATSILGMVRINKEEALEFIEGRINEITSTLLDDSDGMITRECTGATQSLLSMDNKIWIPTIEGVSILDPENLIINTKIPSVYIEEIYVDDEKVKPITYNHKKKNNSIIIGPGHRNYTINYTSLSMYSPGKVLFKYMLEGFDNDWIEIGPERQAKYTNLPYGTYLFKVLAANNDGVWSANPASVEIIIKPFFYNTRWFIILLILAFILLTILLYFYQTKAVKNRNKELVKLNSELDSFSYSVSHDLKAPLSSIKGLLAVAKLEKGENAMEYYNRIDTSVEKLDSFIKDVIDYSKNSRMELRREPVKVKEIISGVVESLTYLNKEKAIDVALEIEDELVIMSDKTRFIYIINNLITNSFRYADFTKAKPSIKIKASVVKDRFILRIKDNGQGIKKELQAKIYDMFYRANENSEGSGLGLYIVKESLLKLNGEINIDSEYEIGTTVDVEFPV